MKYCDGRGTSYKNGNSFDDCKKIAEKINTRLKITISDNGSMPWNNTPKK